MSLLFFGSELFSNVYLLASNKRHKTFALLPKFEFKKFSVE